ncbi:hypothetical protein [Microcoleus sp. PH2017_30_WIL_O_A]|uniref:hypothetical protein n=1 Tax=Microcoleus sp. PH2017_30_WIL_O_A TaxID=2798840 RepID=UPI001DAF9037|nr:hypothetical protein [Microcoleus sp. PH2017_30_WIL_O_A]MCC3582681.1 hypothetical protein [Microcoleus sp. PH2017_30_WIL_O_A]
MNSPTIKIHEFSTGIQAEKTPDGGWVSRGFAGEYMNKTVDPIPAAVQSAIANREFAVAEGASSDDPAILGREVRGDGQDWSAIAVVTRGRDDKGRKPTMYRYFLCEGLGNLSKILTWMNTQQQAGQMPIFNPFDNKVVGQPTTYQDLSQPLPPLRPELDSLLANNAPIIIPSEQRCTVLIINQMAIEKVKENGQPVAWAYKAEALEQPRSFQVIQPASEKAEQLLQRAISSTPQYSAPIAGEQEVKSAIKGLISRDKVKPEQVQAIETAINKIQDSDWEVIFNGQGSSQALREGIYSPQMVRLLTLRAMVIPQTLPEFLDWMQRRGKQEDHYQVSEVFQSEISNFFTQNPGQPSYILSKVNQGVVLIVPRIIQHSELLNPTVWLLKLPSGIWRKLYYQFVSQNIKNELTLMNPRVSNPKNTTRTENPQPSITDDDRWKMIFHELKVYWQNRSYPPDDKYLPLAELFSGLDESEMAAFFYQVSLGCVPKKIFSQLKQEGWKPNVPVYGLRIKKQVGLVESLLNSLLKIGGKNVPLAIVVILLILTFMGGFWSGGALNSSQKPGETTRNDSKNVQQSDVPVDKREGDSAKPANKQTTVPDSNPNDSEKELEHRGEGMEPERFQTTIDSIDKIVRDVRINKPEESEEDVLKALREVLGVGDLDYYGAKNYDNRQQIKLVKAIHSYQGRKFNKPLGYINDKQKTFNALKQDIESKLL